MKVQGGEESYPRCIPALGCHHPQPRRGSDFSDAKTVKSQPKLRGDAYTFAKAEKGDLLWDQATIRHLLGDTRRPNLCARAGFTQGVESCRPSALVINAGDWGRNAETTNRILGE